MQLLYNKKENESRRKHPVGILGFFSVVPVFKTSLIIWNFLSSFHFMEWSTTTYVCMYVVCILVLSNSNNTSIFLCFWIILLYILQFASMYTLTHFPTYTKVCMYIIIITKRQMFLSWWILYEFSLRVFFRHSL